MQMNKITNCVHIVNALAHRDYGFIEGSIAVRVRDNSIEISSPGELLRPLTINDLEKGEFEPITRNKVIVKVLVEEKLMEERGTGFIRMRELAKECDLESFDFKEHMGFFKVIFHSKRVWGKEVKERKVVLPDKILKTLDADQLKILEILEKENRIQTSDCEKAIGKTRRTIIRKLTELVDKEILTQVGKRGKAVYYQLNERFQK